MTSTAEHAGAAIERVRQMVEAYCDDEREQVRWLLNVMPQAEAGYAAGYLLGLIWELATQGAGSEDAGRAVLRRCLPGIAEDAAASVADVVIEEALHERG